MKKKQKTAALSHEFDKCLTDIESLLKETVNLTGDELVQARSKLHQRIKEGRGSVNTFSHDLALRATKSAAKANRKVHDEPWKAIGGAAAAGLLFGMLITRE